MHLKFLFAVSTLHHCSHIWSKTKYRSCRKNVTSSIFPQVALKQCPSSPRHDSWEHVLYEQNSQHNILQSCQAERRRSLVGRIFVKVSFEDSPRLLLLVLSLQSYFSSWLLTFSWRHST